MGWQSFSHNGHRGRNKCTAHETLARTSDNHCREVGRNSAKNREAGERGDCNNEQVSKTKESFKPSAKRNYYDFGDEKRGCNPGALRAACPDLALNHRES